MIATRWMRPLLALTACAVLAGCHMPSGTLGATPPPELTLRGVTVHTFRGSEAIGIGTARQLTYERTSGDSVATQARMNVLSTGEADGGRKTFQLDADTVAGNALSKVADARGHVTLHGERGLVGTTEQAHFDGVRNLARGHTPLTLRGKGYATRADGFTAFLGKDELLLEGDVTSSFGGKR